MNTKKIIQLFTWILFFVVFSLYYWPEYWEFHNTQKSSQEYQILSSNTLKDFWISQLKEFKWDLQLNITPDKELLTRLVSEIDAAQVKVYIEVYIFTEKDLRDALIRAYTRWVDVKILLENNPYQAPYLNDAHYNAFVDAGIDVRWSDPLNYSLNHSKLLLIDDYGYVSTWNFSYSLFTKNRDFLVYLNDAVFVWKLKELFLLDYERIAGGVLDPNLVLSPWASRVKLTELIKSSLLTLEIYFPYLADEELENILLQKSKDGIKIRLIVEKIYYNENPESIEVLKKAWIDVRPMSGPKLHAKSILADSKTLYIWSINFSKYSLDENREIGILSQNTNLISDFKDIFEKDFN